MTVRQIDSNGWYEVGRNPLSKVGVFPYLGATIGAPEPDKIYMVYRPEEELSDPDTLASFRLLPWTDDHTMLGDPDADPALTAAENKGVHGVIGEQVEYDPNDRTMYSNVKVWSKRLADLIAAGKKELSCGFRCVYEFTNGTFEGQPFQAIQRFIRGNHLASVGKGRMGPGVAVLDHLKFTFDAEDLIAMTVAANQAKAAKKTAARDALYKKIGNGMDRAAFDKAMDEDDEEDNAADDEQADLTLSDISDMLEQVAGPLAKIQESLGTMSGAGAGTVTDPDDMTDDDMEPVLDAGGNQVIENGKPKMQKKAAPAAAAAVPATTDAIPAMDASLTIMRNARASLPANTAAPVVAAMDAQINKLESQINRVKSSASMKPVMDSLADISRRLAKIEKPAAATAGVAMDEATFTARIGKRDALAQKISQVVGTFDHASMTLEGVQQYGVKQLKLTAPKGTEGVALDAYFAARPAAPRANANSFGLDAATVPASAASKVADFISGAPAKAA